jgi:polygalacturonase
VQVRNEGGTWHEIFEYNAVNRNKGPFVGSQVPLSNMTFAYFDSDFRNRIEVKVTMNNRASINNVRIRPTSYGITYIKSGYSISFFLDEPRNISVEFEGDTYHNLLIYANAREVNPPKEGDVGVTYYGPGIHNVGSINLGTGKTIYLAGGAIVMGSITGNNITNASIRGHGILQNGTIHINNSSNITIEGIIIIDSPGWTIVPSQVNNSLIQNVKIINQVVSSDGTDVSGCSDLTFDNVFYRIPDDCISLKCNKVTKPNKNILIKNSVFWADAAHGILIGPEGNGTSTSDVLITNCDFLEAKSSGSEYWGIIGITNGDNMTIRDITIENCRVEDFSYSNLVSIRVEKINQWITAPGGPIKNIVFRNITFNGNNANANYIKGYDDTQTVDSVTFDNLQINGQRIMSAQQGNFTIGPFATNVMFK